MLFLHTTVILNALIACITGVEDSGPQIPLILQDPVITKGVDLIVSSNLRILGKSVSSEEYRSIVMVSPMSSVNKTSKEFEQLTQQLSNNVNTRYNNVLMLIKICNPQELSTFLALVDSSLANNIVVFMIANFTLDYMISHLERAEVKFQLNHNIYYSSLSDNFKRRFEIYYVKKIRILQEVSNNKPISMYELFYNLHRRYNLHQVPIVGVARPNKHYAEYESNSNSPNNKFTGGIVVLQYWHLRDILNFSEGAIISETMREGPNGTLTGYAIPINNGSGDICVSRTEFLLFRLKGPDAISFLHPFTNSKTKVYFIQPSVRSARDVYKSVYSVELWIGLTVLWVILGLAFVILQYLQGSVHNFYSDLSHGFIWMFASIAVQGNVETESIHKLDRIKLISFNGALVGFICSIIFSSKLYALFSTEVKLIGKFDDLITHGKFIYGDVFFPTAGYQIQAMQDSGKLAALPVEVRNVDPSDKLDELLSGKSAIISTQEIFNSGLIKKNITGPEACALFDSLTVTEDKLKLAMFVKRGSPFKDFFNVKTLVLSERGISNRDFFQHKQKLGLKCWSRPMLNVTPALEVKDVFSAFLILSGGFLISALCVAFELITRTPSDKARMICTLDSTFTFCII